MTRAPRLALAAMLLLVPGCHKQVQTAAPAPPLASSLLRLTRALHAELGHTPNEGLVAAVFRKKPELQREFGEYTVRTQSNAANVVVLVCSKDGRYALFEDASWTAFVDKKYEAGAQCPAVPTIDPAAGPGVAR